MRLPLILALLLMLGGTWTSHAAEAPPGLPPRPTHYVTDQSGLLNPAVASSLEQQLANVERQTSNQILVAIYPHLPEGEEIAQYATNTFESWGVGQKGKDNGVVLFIFALDHKLFIATGRGLEGALPDALCKRIILHEIVPRFRQNDFSGGVQAGVSAMVAASQGEYKGTGQTVTERNGDGTSLPGWAVILIFIAIVLIIIFQSNTPGGLGRSYYLSSGGGNWSGGGSSGGWGGGGGGFSGGGGSSAGGGAGGSW